MKLIRTLTAFGAIGCIALMSLSFTLSETKGEDNWTLVKSSSEINVYGQVTQCDGQAVYLFKLENLSQKSQTVSVTIDIPNQYAYGPQTYEEILESGKSTVENCEEAKMKLPRVNQDDNNSLDGIKIQVTTK
jgi:hypothetical protein